MLRYGKISPRPGVLVRSALRAGDSHRGIPVWEVSFCGSSVMLARRCRLDANEIYRWWPCTRAHRKVAYCQICSSIVLHICACICATLRRRVSVEREREVGSQTALWRRSTLLSNFMVSKNDRGGREWDHERPVNDASKPDATADAAAAIRDPGWTWSVKALCMKSFVPQAICALRQVIRPAWCAVMTERGRHTLLALCDGESHRRERGREGERARERQRRHDDV